MRLIFLLCFFIITIDSPCQVNYFDNVIKADSFYSQNKYSEAYNCYVTAFNYRKGFSKDYLNAARTSSMLDDSITSIKYLYLAYVSGFDNIDIILEDNSFNNIRKCQNFNGIIDSLQKIISERDKKYPFRSNILSMYENDQKFRIKRSEFFKKNGYANPPKEIEQLLDSISIFDSINIYKVLKIIETYGWLGPSEIGNKPYLTIFLIIQHANDVTIEQYLPLLAEAVKKQNAPPEHYALMMDRIKMFRKEKQIYGTQVQCDSKGNCFLYPIEDEINVNKIRREMGMESLSEYLKNWNIVWPINNE